jgi:hypothetical protein
VITGGVSTARNDTSMLLEASKTNIRALMI